MVEFLSQLYEHLYVLKEPSVTVLLGLTFSDA